jgi:SAM-dependent methyltransferase
MDVSVSSSTENALRSFFEAPSASVHAVFRQLDAEFRTPAHDDAVAVPAAFTVNVVADSATAAGRAAVPELASALHDEALADRFPHLVMLLALLAGTDAHDLVRAEIPGVLALFAAADRSLAAALLYFAGQFPEERDLVLAASKVLELGPDDRSRLTRSLAPEYSAEHNLGREWPAPAMWAVTEAEREADRQNWLAYMSEQDMAALWQADTRKIRDYSALKAVALLDAPPRPYSAEAEHREPEPAAAADGAVQDTASATDRLASVGAVLACPDCRARVRLAGAGARCDGCGKDFPATDDWLDLSSDAGQSMEAMIISDPTQAGRYERGLRPAFLRAMGRDFDTVLTVDKEVDFLERHIGAADGVVLDLAAGAGHFTRVLTRAAPGRVIPFDLSVSMLKTLQATPPKLPAIRGTALRLPVADASLGAVNCWNALQTLPEQEQVIHEVSRSLADGGTFTLFTCVQDSDPLYREFQDRQARDLRVELQSRETLIRWLTEAGFAIREELGAGLCLLLAATRHDR